jgi:aryl-alcohol dehydrogenase-like predicted oxidoreductase
MRHVRPGRTGLSVSRLCLGTMPFGLLCDEPASLAILEKGDPPGRGAMANRRRREDR